MALKCCHRFSLYFPARSHRHEDKALLFPLWYGNESDKKSIRKAFWLMSKTMRSFCLPMKTSGIEDISWFYQLFNLGDICWEGGIESLPFSFCFGKLLMRSKSQNLFLCESALVRIWGMRKISVGCIGKYRKELGKWEQCFCLKPPITRDFVSVHANVDTRALCLFVYLSLNFSFPEESFYDVT